MLSHIWKRAVFHVDRIQNTMVLEILKAFPWVLLTQLVILYLVSKRDFRLILAGVYCCWKSTELGQYEEELWLRNHPRKLLKSNLFWIDLKLFSFLQCDSLKPRCLFLFLKVIQAAVYPICFQSSYSCFLHHFSLIHFILENFCQLRSRFTSMSFCLQNKWELFPASVVFHLLELQLWSFDSIFSSFWFKDKIIIFFIRFLTLNMGFL